MNWTVRKYNKVVESDDEHCEHLKVGDISAKAHAEADSFGHDTWYHMCPECKKQSDEFIANELLDCVDCGQQFARKNGIEWKHYEFSAAQGDEPLCICNDCRAKPRHQARVAEYVRMREEDSDY